MARDATTQSVATTSFESASVGLCANRRDCSVCLRIEQTAPTRALPSGDKHYTKQSEAINASLEVHFNAFLEPIRSLQWSIVRNAIRQADPLCSLHLCVCGSTDLVSQSARDATVA